MLMHTYTHKYIHRGKLAHTYKFNLRVQGHTLIIKAKYCMLLLLLLLFLQLLQ